MNTKKVLIGVAIVVVVALGVIFPRGNSVVNQITQLGAVSGPEINSPFLTVNGVETWFYKQPMKQATTSICQLITPPYRTVLVPFSLTAEFTTSSTSASNVVIATSSAFSTATTTLIAQRAIGANLGAAVVATTSTASLIDGVFAASTWINVSMAGGIGTFSPVGNCQAMFRKI